MTTGVNHTPVGIMGSSFFIIRSRSRIILLGFYLEEWMNRNPAVYILLSKRNGTLYIGVTSDLMKRVWEHKHDLVEGFTHK
jgi:hypothetical protein